MATKFVDMALSKAEIKEERGEGAVSMSGQPDPYPWGLSLSLESRELKKLGITKLPGVGSEMHLLCIAKVTSVNQSTSQDSEESRVGLQICMMQVVLQESAEEEKGKKETPAAESRETPSLMKHYKG